MARTNTRASVAHRNRNHKPTFNPFTPMRKLFLKADRTQAPPQRVRKRRSNYSIVPTPSSSHHPKHHHAPPTTRIALQNEDPEMDAVVITALDSVPFCCHEELVGMTRDELVEAAEKMNEKLPGVLCVDVGKGVTGRGIRNAIEVLVGIRIREGRREGLGEEEEEDGEGEDGEGDEGLLGASPLGQRGTGRRTSVFGSPCVTPRLERLVEEEEDGETQGGEMTPIRSRYGQRKLSLQLQESPTLRRRATSTSHARKSTPLRAGSGYRSSSLSIAHSPF
ncbi:hypothetical protein PQX77_009934 [Marasmius sp. AFHP31]|nr:hypothetical protein PQX77_009934 [Marasmius sp. AFHP31]